MVEPGQEIADEVSDWGAIETWLASAVRYRDSWGSGSERFVADDLAELRGKIGDNRLLPAIERAQALGLHGESLLDFLRRTCTGRRRRAS